MNSKSSIIWPNLIQLYFNLAAYSSFLNKFTFHCPALYLSVIYPYIIECSLSFPCMCFHRQASYTTFRPQVYLNSSKRPDYSKWSPTMRAIMVLKYEEKLIVCTNSSCRELCILTSAQDPPKASKRPWVTCATRGLACIFMASMFFLFN